MISSPTKCPKAKRHHWEELNLQMEDFGAHGKRRCHCCGLIQLKQSVQEWGRVVGYRWEDVVQ